ncbi:SDR family oxidoreductase [Actinomadura physcomitrii]
MKTFGRVDLMVDNAGWSRSSTPLLDLEPDDWDHYMAVNVRGTLNLFSVMRSRGVAGCGWLWRGGRRGGGSSAASAGLAMS